MTDRHLIWAVFSALLCPLRQTVGSCFSTAPAILVQKEQMEVFLDDLQSLCARGLLSRTFEGTTFSVPISPSPGLGELHQPYMPKHSGFTKALHAVGLHEKKDKKGSYLSVLKTLFLEQKKSFKEEQFRKAKWHMVAFTEHLLLKTWEFTLASFVDVKTEFSRWNLFSSLGLHAEEKGGIGELVYTYLERKLDEANKKLDKYQNDYEIAFDHVRLAERLLKNAAAESEVRRLRAEHQARLHHMQSCLELRDRWHLRAQNIANFFPFFIDGISEEAQELFQEAYDAEMRDVDGLSYDDSRAGFRLLYKHRRAHVGSWSFIYSRQEYIDALKDFFLAIENPLIERCEWEGAEREIPHLITEIIHHINTEEFLFAAFYRMAKAHRVPLKKLSLDQLEQMEKKPWAYTSGGTLRTLLKTYFQREGTLSEEARWVESPQDLLIFLLETLKTLPPKTTSLFLRDSEKRMLMTSPTHVFSLFPGYHPFCEGWKDPGFTYTWVRDQIIHPAKKFYASIRLNAHDQLFLVQEFAKNLLPVEGLEFQRHFTPSDEPLTIQDFFKRLSPSSKLSLQLEAFLFEMLPLITPDQVKLGIQLSSQPPLMGRRQFHDQIISTYPNYQEKDCHLEVADFMEKRGLASPKPLIFADTNWTNSVFAFLVNPINGNLELWQTDKLGLTGVPMRQWDLLLNGVRKEPWSLFLQPHEYRRY